MSEPRSADLPGPDAGLGDAVGQKLPDVGGHGHPPGTSPVLERVREALAGAAAAAAAQLESGVWSPLESAAARVEAAGREAAPRGGGGPSGALQVADGGAEAAEGGSPAGRDAVLPAARALRSLCDAFEALELPARTREAVEGLLERLAAAAEEAPPRAVGREVTQNVEPEPGDPRWVRAGKWLKRHRRAWERAVRGAWSGIPFLRHRAPPPLEAPTRSVPAAEIVRFVLRADAARAVAGALELDGPPVAAASALPVEPGALADEATGAAAVVRRAASEGRRLAARGLEELRARAEARVEELFLVGGTFEYPRRQLRPERRERLTRRAREELTGRLEESAARLRRELDARRLEADLATLSGQVAAAATPLRGRLQRGAAESGVLEGIAGAVRREAEEAARAAAAGSGAEGRKAASRRLEALEASLRRRLDPRLLDLPDVSRPGDPLRLAAETFVDRSREAAERLAERYELPRSDGRPRPARFAARAHALELLRERLEDENEGFVAAVAEAARDARGSLGEAWEVVRYNLSAARAELALGGGAASEAAELVRGGCERAARRLEAAAGRLAERMAALAERTGSLDAELAAELRERARAAGTTEGQMGEARRTLARGAERAERAAGLAARTLRRWGRWLVEGARRLHHKAQTQLETLSQSEAAAARVRRIAAEVAEVREAAETAGLPPIYRWLFRSDPLDDPTLLVGRGEELARLTAVRRLWEEERPATVAVVGDYGSGRSSVINCALPALTAEAAWHRGQVDRRLSDAAETYAWFARFLAVERPETVQDAAGLAAALGERREIVVLEHCERLFRRRVGGYEAARAFGEIMAATDGRIAWIASFGVHAWHLLEAVTSLESRFVEVIELEPLGRDALEEAILARHRVTGYDLHFEPEEERGTRRRKKLARLGAEERQERLRRWFFDDLHEASRGVPRTGMLLWRVSLREAEDARVVVGPLRRLELGFIATLEREVLFALAAYLQHGDLADDELPALMGTPEAQASQILDFLRQTRMLERMEGLPPPPVYRVSPLLSAAVVAALREKNIIHL